MTPSACRPFSKDRNGMTLGEGAAVFIIESEKALAERGGVALAEIAGYGTSSDAKDLIRPDPDGTANAMRFALADAGLTASDIGYINAHGTATILNDQVESGSIRAVFGDKAPPVSSTKPIHGHALGAAGAIELIITVMALREQIAPPTINWRVEDPACPVDCVPNEARRISATAVMSNSFAFGGINSCLVVKEAA
jgi:nodulation protein E